jgi:hypothetical protein
MRAGSATGEARAQGSSLTACGHVATTSKRTGDNDVASGQLDEGMEGALAMRYFSGESYLRIGDRVRKLNGEGSPIQICPNYSKTWRIGYAKPSSGDLARALRPDSDNTWAMSDRSYYRMS